ncbi:hypothetical protein HPB50_008779 [Hyalomma asiaticum]|uniref:Uncharacterized protein n=1 Tax=Hyalomma asiaticum TaxID=266040 RepID=A0ACB7S565_HYAAI|nr:hypothetical protein HPB50_008779 [Hyalomma asiaticum]
MLIMDEPTAGLDPETRRTIWSLVKELRGKTSILLSTHDMEEADVLADRIIVMYNGSVICWGSPTFLKNACGVGYKLRIQKEQKTFKSDSVMAVVKSSVPQAMVQEEKDNEVVIALNTMKRERFPVMFKALEEGGKKLGIVSIGVSLATMTDAYLNYINLSTSFSEHSTEPSPMTFTGSTTEEGDNYFRYKALLDSQTIPYEVTTDVVKSLQAKHEENYPEYASTCAFGTVFNKTA